MADPNNKILTTLLDRIYGTLVHGPCLNCRVHNSRQRIDLFNIIALQHLSVKEIVPGIITEQQRIEIKGKVSAYHGPEEEELMSEKDRAHRMAYEAQSRLLARLRDITEDARDYEQETGENALYIGYPFISLPPGNDVAGTGKPTPRILAPLALIAVDMTVKRGAVQSVSMAARGEGIDLVIPNYPLLAWLENQTGRDTSELFADEEGELPYQEINEIARLVAEMLQIDAPTEFAAITPFDAIPKTADLPNKPVFLNSAALGLFPVSNQGLLRDLKAMASGKDITGPVEFFLNAQVESTPIEAEFIPEQADRTPRDFTRERLITRADPFQAQAVREAEEHPLLVIHGPPGTGKSQTITNIIGDHLARGERILMVCDKRTAIDVVYNRLEHLGLSDLCALVHDSQRDQRPLYMKIRNYLDTLPDRRMNRRVNNQLEETDKTLRELHNEIIGFFNSLNLPGANGETAFHDLVGQWFSIDAQANVEKSHIENITSAVLDECADALREVLDRALKIDYSNNLWAAAAGISLSDFLTTPVNEFRARMDTLVVAGNGFDTEHPTDAPPLPAEGELEQHALHREKLAADLTALELLKRDESAVAWLAKVPDATRTALEQLQGILPMLAAIKAKPLDAELALNLAGGIPALPQINRYVVAVANYEEIADKWYGFLFFGRKSAAETALTAYGMPTDKSSALRLREFLTGVKERLVARQAFEQYAEGKFAAPGLPRDSELVPAIESITEILGAVAAVQSNPQFTSLRASILATYANGGGESSKSSGTPFPESGSSRREEALTNPTGESQSLLTSAATIQGLIRALELSARRARAIRALLDALDQSRFFETIWLNQLDQQLRGNQEARPSLEQLHDLFPTLEDVLRCQQAFRSLPESVRHAASDLIHDKLDGATGILALRKELIGKEIARRIQDDPQLQQVDQEKMLTLLGRYAELSDSKQKLSRDYILNRWAALQKELLVDDKRKQMNSAGTSLKRRLITRGKRSMKLRQMIHYGLRGAGFQPAVDFDSATGEKTSPVARSVKGKADSSSRQDACATGTGDPLFDICPVWMASPATVALIFPRKPIFDVIIFDEASQCRLEEAVPVLTRGKRIVIAGDPKQLPPTRFFESALAETEIEDVESEQDLFEQQQADTEDLLGAALNLQIRQSYLDVHYRSRHESLIGFSNKYFYRNRLQPVPAHPSIRPPTAAIQLRRIDGAYVKRRNEMEADAVVQLVRDLLKQKTPPSIGIACFNLVQRDLILDRLEDEADRDNLFGARYETARNRKGEGSFEGLFVKNLENVQGDERDHMIISTTFGPDDKGKFRRNFGPVGRQGGGRRLNVLVTRAREKIHVITSIPRSEYKILPDLDDKQSPGGRWLLYAYLNYAETLAEKRKQESLRELSSQTGGEAEMTVVDSLHPSELSIWFGKQLAQSQQSSDVHWGNDGFCVDLALHHPERSDQRTLGVLCDLHRFTDTPDLADWEIFRTALLQSKGWQFQRVFSPGLFRDWQKHQARIIAEANQLAVTMVFPELAIPEPEIIPSESSEFDSIAPSLTAPDSELSVTVFIDILPRL